MKLNSSTAQTAHSSSGVFVLLLIMFAPMLVILGCGGSVATASAKRSSAVSAASEGAQLSGLTSDVKIARSADGRIAIDAGVVFADQESYLCFPLKQLGVEEHLSTNRVESSCECVEATIVHYLDPTVGRCPALLLRFRQESVVQEAVSGELSETREVRRNPDKGFESAPITPVNLGVDVTIDLENGRQVNYTVNFLHTVIQE